MKTRTLPIIGIILGMGIIAILALYYENSDPQIICGTEFILQGNSCVLNSEFIEPDTVMIYDLVENSETRLSIAPRVIVMNLTGDDTVTFVNDGTDTVNIFDNSEIVWQFGISERSWSFDNVKPSSQRTLIINGTGYYQFLIQNSEEGRIGEIIALSKDTNSLPVEMRAKMAQGIVSSDFGRDVGLVGVGSGGEPGITIDIDKKFRDKHDNAEKFYYEKYKEMIPFEVPITIEFTAPIFFRNS